jgi:hypothetical protein
VVQGDTGHMYKWLAGIATFREVAGSGRVRLIGPSRMAPPFPRRSPLLRSAQSCASRRDNRVVNPPDNAPNRANA